jgi:hypothetical protein
MLCSSEYIASALQAFTRALKARGVIEPFHSFTLPPCDTPPALRLPVGALPHLHPVETWGTQAQGPTNAEGLLLPQGIPHQP